MQLTRRAAAICGVAELTEAPSPEPAPRGSGVFGNSGAGPPKKIVLGGIQYIPIATAPLRLSLALVDGVRCDAMGVSLSWTIEYELGLGEGGKGKWSWRRKKGDCNNNNNKSSKTLRSLRSLRSQLLFIYLFTVYRSPEKRMST